MTPTATVRILAMALVIALLPTASVADPADEPAYVAWPDLLPGLTTAYDPSSSNLCTAGHVRCVDAVIREMDSRLKPLTRSCDHDAVFALVYLRTTEEYRRTIEDPNFFVDTAFVNHQDAVFAKLYFDAFDAWHKGKRDKVPPAWRVLFSAAENREVSGTGNLLLGMSAHVNRDLPLALAEIGLVRPDGSSRKDDHNQVNQFLVRVVQPVIDEVARRYDPAADDAQIDGTTLDETGTLQLLFAWREEAWRNAERIALADTPAQKARVIRSIEDAALAKAELLKAQTAYRAPLSSSATRDAWCAEHSTDA
ncbi:MAG: DUF5995 family protein [Actinomycetota bacterium]|jgi:hypothetical protein|nr:hypothetical protein [Euzebyaceae bacterium]MDQ3452431.1 DUF5995 family protein [Actinomycetota bacterium]